MENRFKFKRIIYSYIIGIMGYRPVILGIKFVDIFLLSTYYLIFGISIASFIDVTLGKFISQDEDKKSTVRIFAEAAVYTFALLIIFYIIRNIVERIPFPLDGLYGFQHSRVKERTGDVAFVFILFYFQSYYIKKLVYLHNRIKGIITGITH